MDEFQKLNSLSDKIGKIDNNSIKYSTINQSNNNIQEILNKYSNYSQKIKHFQIYNPQYINSSINYNFSTIRLNTTPNSSNINNRYINDSFKNNQLTNDYSYKNKQYFPSPNFSNYNIKTNKNSIYNQIYSKKNNNPEVKNFKTNTSHISNINDFSYNFSLKNYKSNI